MASSPVGQEAEFARTSTSTETAQLLDLLSRSDRARGILRVAVVGDVHGAWSDADAVAMRALEADVLAFVGDFGNEAVPVVERISKVGELIAKSRGRGGGGRSGGGRSGIKKVPGVAVVCGNHDAWNSMTARGRERGRERARAAAAAKAAAATASGGGGGGGGATAEEEDDGGGDDDASAGGGGHGERNNSGDPLVPAAASPGVAKQLRLLGRLHVGFSWRAFGDDDDEAEGGAGAGAGAGAAAAAAAGGTAAGSPPSAFAAVVGGRPFSQGGPDFKRVDQFYREMYGVEGFEDSAERIARGLREAAAHLGKRGKGGANNDGGADNNNDDDDDDDDDEDKGTALLLIAHNGPSGLGGLKHDICGADFLEDGGDWGDPDLEEALRRVREHGGGERQQEEEEEEETAEAAATATTTAATTTTSTSSPSCFASASPCLVAFGHMHRSLRHVSSAFKERNAVEICPETGEDFFEKFRFLLLLLLGSRSE